MPTTAAPARRRASRRRNPRGRKRKNSSLLLWWPLVLALVATPFAVRAASVLALSGPGALRLLYPFVVLVQAHAPAALAPEQRDTLAQWTMWAQFPVYGLAAALTARWRGIAAGVLLIVLLHTAAIVAALVFSR